MPQTLYQHIGSLHHLLVQASFAEQERKHGIASKFSNYRKRIFNLFIIETMIKMRLTRKKFVYIL